VAGFLRALYDAFCALGRGAARDLGAKVRVMRQSLAKVENACYLLTLRGSELPRHMLADALALLSQHADADAPC